MRMTGNQKRRAETALLWDRTFASKSWWHNLSGKSFMFKVQNPIYRVTNVDIAIFGCLQHRSVVVFGAALGWTQTESRLCAQHRISVHLRPLRTIPTVSALRGITHCRVFVLYPANFVGHTVAFAKFDLLKCICVRLSMLFFNLVWWPRFLINCVLKLETWKKKIPQIRHAVALKRDFLLKWLENTTVDSLLVIWFPKTFCNHVCTCDDSGAELGVLTT